MERWRSHDPASSGTRRGTRTAIHTAVRIALQLPRLVRAALRLCKYAYLIHRSRLFDAGFYLSQCPDDPSARRTPIFHYLLRGTVAGLDPNPFFDTSFYLEQYPYSGANGKNPFIHFLRHGRRERKAPSTRFEIADHLARRRAAADAEPDPFAHYATPGGEAVSVLAHVAVTREMRAGLDRAGDFADAAQARRVLVVDRRLPSPDRDSASVRMFAILKLLRRLGHEVTFVFDDGDWHGRDRRAIRRLGVDVLQGFNAAARHLAAHGHEYGAALLSSPQAAERYAMPVRAYALRAKLIYDTVDLHWVRLERAAAVTGDEEARAAAARYRRLEQLHASCADTTLTVTVEEREALLREVPEARVEVLPNIHASEGTLRPWAARRDIMFIGAFAHAPNADAVEWFAHEIFPLVKRRLPDVVFRVVGSDVPRFVRQLAAQDVRVLGHVRNVRPIFEASQVFVSPLRYGAGMKGKIGQSMSHGLPVVTTSIGAEGMMLVDGENALIADDPAAFADAVVRLATDEALWSRISVTGMRHVERHFSEEAALGRVAALLDFAPADAAQVAQPVPALVRIRP
jgi:glycosyltransferase involved in cell wall biosynthesis